MATLTKPKKTKTKRQRPLVDRAQEEEEDNNLSASYDQEQRQLENVSLLEEFERVVELASSNSNKAEDIISHDCCISSEVPVDGTAEGLQEPTEPGDPLEEETSESNQTEVEPEATPSAPCAPHAPIVSAPVVQYPNLQPIRITNALLEEQKTQIVYKEPKVRSPGFALASSHLKPFTLEQLREIYRCTDVELVKQFELEFLMNTLLESSEADPLYIALQEYYNLQEKLSSNLHDIKNKRKACLEIPEMVWTREPVTRNFSGRCSDGNVVRESVTYDKIALDQIKYGNATTALTVLYEMVCITYTTNLYNAKIAKVKVEQLINELLAFPDVDSQETIVLHHQLDESALQCVSKLRRAICILFNFARRPSPNANFDADLKSWLRKLVALQLLLATKEDHWFLLFNILRCPNGVGSWAAEFLQLPGMVQAPRKSKGTQPSELPLPLNSPEVNHCIVVLQILLLPIKKRNDFLKSQVQAQRDLSETGGCGERWTVVDSDGEDTLTPTGECVGLKETDLIALLNQLPFDKLFTSAMSIEKFLDDYIIEPDMITPQKMLTVLAFFAQLIETLGDGMLTYNNERYKQLAKRLGRLVRHSLQYAYDYHELFLNNNLVKPPDLCERIELEIQALLIRACSYIYRSRNLGTWQYFSTLPYTTLHADIIWHLFYYLNVGFPSDLSAQLTADPESLFQTDFWSKFDLANADVSAEDMYYLLQAFFEMANARDRTKDWPIIRIICLTIFQIGFIHEATREYCYKAARDMLVNITLAYEELLDCLLLQLKSHYADIDQAAYLFKALPLENWHPSMDSFDLLSNWLLHFDYQTSENQLARLIIGHLNWSFDEEGRLFLPHNIHVRMACLVAEAITKHAPEVIGASSISESVRQVSSLIDSTQSIRDQFTSWCWRMVSMLRLHLMDQSVESVKRTLQHPTEPLLFVPELERVDMIWQGVTEQRPLALYVGVLVSLHGHSIPVICQHGFQLLHQLLSDHRHAAVIRSLELIVPLFLETPDTLANCESFQKLLITLLNADRTYLKMAKDMVYANSIGPILELLDNMLHHQIVSYTSFGLCSPLNLINIWLNCFTTLPNWAQNMHVLYLLDKMLRIAYQFADCSAQAVEFFYNYYKDCNEWKLPAKSSTLKSLFGGQSNSRIPAILPQTCWLNLILLEIEFRLQDSRFWPELLRQLSTLTVEAALKKTLSFSKSNIFPVQQLVIYKYAQLLTTMDVRHALFPIICEKFFELYLWRVPTDDAQSFNGNYGVSEKFYEHNISQMKSIKAQIKSAEVYYAAIATKRADDESAAHLYRSCTKLMQSCALWLEDTQINKIASDACQLPAQYNSEKLRELLNGHANHWTEFLSPSDLCKEQRYQADQWSAKIYRVALHKTLRTPLQPKPRPPPAQRLKMHLSTYDKRLPPPRHLRPELIQKRPIDGDTLSQLKQRIQTLNSTANKYHYNSSELNSLNLDYLERVPALYQMVPYKENRSKECESLLFNRKCLQPAKIELELEYISRNEQVARIQDRNRERHDKIVEEMLSMNAESFAQALDELGSCIRQLVLQHDEVKSNTMLTQIGVKMFYHVVENMTDVTMKFKPTNNFYSQTLQELGVFIQDQQVDEGIKIFRLALKRGDLLELLAGVFVPCRTDADHFLEMYQLFIESYLNLCDTKILFVLLSKFDLLSWMEAFHPKLSEINRLLLLVLQGLESWSQPHSRLVQDQFRRQLVHIFTYDFPQHYGEVMQLVLDRMSDQKLMPVVLLDLLNALLSPASASLTLETNDTQLQELASEFARRQKLFTLKASTETLLLFARHFQKERLHHGLYGLYPKHKDYCRPLVMWFACFGNVLLSTAICCYQELLADQISDIVFGSIVETYAPWLIPYTEQTELAGSAAHWIRQLSPNQGKVLLPWSEPHVDSSKIMIRSFVTNVLQVVQYLPASSKILEHVFAWYVHHFAQLNVAGHVLSPIHDGLAQLPWERFQPPTTHIEMLYAGLQRFIPESHAMLGHIFIRIDWKTWFLQMPNMPVPLLSHLLGIFIKMAFEPNIHMHPNTSKILEDAVNQPWHLVDYNDLEQLLKWIVAHVDPAIALKLPNESNYADRAVLELLLVACAMLPESETQGAVLQATAKRMLYTRSMVSMQRACAVKHNKLLASKEGERAFSAAFEKLLDAIDLAISGCSGQRTPEEQRREALNLMLELVAPTQTQSEEVSNLHIQSLVRWQHKSAAGNPLMCAALGAIGHLNTFISCIYTLLESSIECYFRRSTERAPWHTPSWQGLLEALQMSLPKLELMPVMRGGYLFSLHIFVLFKLEEMESVGDRVTFIQDLAQLLETLKTTPQTEPRMALVWGLIISRGCKLLPETQQVRKPLYMLARQLQIASTKAEGWSDGLLGAIGLKSENITNKRKVLTRCLACIIYSLFPASRETRLPNEEYESAMRELAMLLANKKFTDVKQLIVRAVSILKEQPIPELRSVPHLICRLIDVLYEESYLTTIPEVWDCDYKLRST